MRRAIRMCACLMTLYHCCLLSAAGQPINALVVIDVQNCFMPGGTNVVPNGNDIIPVINAIRRDHKDFFSLVVLTQDWHCPRHVSFASQHPGLEPFSAINLTYSANGELCKSDDLGDIPVAVDCGEVSHRLTQTIWPDHCVINSTDAAFSPHLVTNPDDVIVRKGQKCEVDSYSGFFDNGGFSRTELHEVLQRRGVTALYIVGVAFDYCVFYTAVDARKLGYSTFVIEDATRSISKEGAKSVEITLENKGVTLLKSWQLGGMYGNGAVSPGLHGWAALPAVLLILYTVHDAH